MAQQPLNETLLKKFSATAYELNYKEQACFFMNAFWQEYGEKECENIWTYTFKFHELDMKEFEEGHALDEFQSARLLEHFGSAMTVLERRAALKEIDIDTDNKMSMLEYLVWKYKCDVAELMKRPQGTNEELKRAQRALKEVQDEIKSIEKKKTQLEKDANGTGVKAMRSKNELEQLLNADQTELNRKIITAEAAVRKAQKNKDVQAAGTMWWLEREIAEAKKYKPKKNIKSTFVN